MRVSKSRPVVDRDVDARQVDDVFIELFAEKLELTNDGDDLDEVISDLSRFGLPGLGELTALGRREKRNYIIDIAWEWLLETLVQARMFDAIMTRLKEEASSKEKSG